MKLKELQGSLKRRLQSHREETKGPSIEEANEGLVISRAEDEGSKPMRGALIGDKVPNFLIDYMAGKLSTKT